MRTRRKTSLLLTSALLLTAMAATGRADQDIVLPDPIYLETFDALDELGLPAGWTVTNQTDTVANHDFDNIDDLNSNTYKNWVVVGAERLRGLKSRIFNLPSITVNGVTLDSLGSGNMFYAETDVRDGSQIQYAFTSDYDLTGKQNVYVVFHSLYEQNQDNINSLEYSIDQGANWLPALYLIDQFKDTQVDNLPFSQGDIYFDPNGNIDAVKTLNTVHGDAAQSKSYGAFIAAPITQDLAPYISGRANDDQTESKRVEIVRLLKADNQSKVRFRFMQAGTGSWYWGIDDFGLYSLPEARINIPPMNVLANVNGTATLKVVASGIAPLTYQWSHNGSPIAGQTSETLTINPVTADSAGEYTVTVKNALGEATNDPAAIVTVIAAPQIDVQPLPVWISAGAAASLSVAASGPSPLTYQWQKDEQNIPGATSATFSIAKGVAGDTGSYRVVVTNPYGTVTSEAVQVNVLDIPITEDLVLHLPFDADANDTSGRGNNGTPQIQPEIADGILPTYDGGGAQLIGSGAIHITDGQDIALGAPEDLQFGADVNFTISFWVKGADASAWTGDPSFIGNKNWTSGGSPGYVIAAQGNGAWKWNWTASDHDRRDIGQPSVTDGKWHNIVVSHDRTGLASFYVDGSLRVTQTIALDGDINSLDTYIGQDGTGRYGFDNDRGAHFKDMHLDDFGIWRRVVTAQEVASIYAHGLKGEDLTAASGAPALVPPTVVSGPWSQVATLGGSVTLSAVVTGSDPFTYQWQKGGVDIAGQTGATLVLSNVDAGAEGVYRLLVTNGAGTASSGAAKIVVKAGSLKDDVVAHIAFDGNYKDSSGHYNHTFPVGAPTLEAGKFGQAMRFTTVKDGSKIDYATFGIPPDLNFGADVDYSVSMWVNWTDSEDDLPFISNKDWNSSNNTGWGIFSQDGGNFRVNVTGTPRGSANKMSSSDTPATVKDGKWHNIVVSFARGFVASSYLDGQRVNTTPLLTTGSIDTGMPVNIGQDGTGKYTDGGSVRMTGLIDDVGVWRHALSAADAAAIFAAGQAGKDLSNLLPPTIGSDIMALIKFDGDYNDYSGRGNDATPKGSPTLEAGKFGQAMRFTTVKDGSKIDYATFGNASDLNFDADVDYSVSMWVNWTDSEDDLPFVSNKDWNSSNNTGWGIFSQSGGNFRVNVTGTPRGSDNKMSTSATPTTVKDGAWHNIVVSFTRGFAVASYLDGNLVNTTPLLTKGSIDTGLPVNIGQDGTGKYTDGGSVRMSGLIDDVAVWRHALTAVDASAIFTAGQAGHDLASLLPPSAFLGKIRWNSANGQTTLTWQGGAGVRLQKSAVLGAGANWQDVAGTAGQSSKTIAVDGDAGFYRLTR